MARWDRGGACGTRLESWETGKPPFSHQILELFSPLFTLSIQSNHSYRIGKADIIPFSTKWHRTRYVRSWCIASLVADSSVSIQICLVLLKKSRIPPDRKRYNDFSMSISSLKSLAYFAASLSVGRGKGLRAKPPYP